MPTPDYTPLASEASAVHTPLSTSTLTEKSISQERSLQVDEELHEKYREEEGSILITYYDFMSTICLLHSSICLALISEAAEVILIPFYTENSSVLDKA